MTMALNVQMNRQTVIVLMAFAMLLTDTIGRTTASRKTKRGFWASTGKILGGVAIGLAFGKRSEPCVSQPTPEQLNLVKTELDKTCSLLNIDFSAGLSRDYVNATYTRSDVNKDGTLEGDEFTVFSEAIVIIEGCAKRELSKAV